MGSISDTIICPKCGSEASDEFYYKTGEEFILCMHCGYTRKFYITNMDMVREDDEVMPEYKLEELLGYGSYRLKPKGVKYHEVGSFALPDSEQEFISMVDQSQDELDYASYTTFKDGVLSEAIVLLDRNPEDNG